MAELPCVLLVDDDVLHRTFLRDALSAVRCTVLEARDGEEALALLERHAPRVVLLDLVMPRTSGLEVLKASQALPSPAQVWVISGLDTDSLVQQAMALGARGFFSKPVHPLDAVEAVQAVLGQS